MQRQRDLERKLYRHECRLRLDGEVRCSRQPDLSRGQHLCWFHAKRGGAELRPPEPTVRLAESGQRAAQHGATCLYDVEGHRVQQVATTSGGTATTTSYIGRLEEVGASGSTTTTTAYYGGVALSVNGALSYTFSDGLGSVSESVNSSGTVSATQLYGPYGAVRYHSGTLPTSKGYTGQRADATSGLDYYGARYYDPVAGQFSSADTTLAGGLNRYAYVHENPETRTDPSGHFDEQELWQLFTDWLDTVSDPNNITQSALWVSLAVTILTNAPKLPPPDSTGANYPTATTVTSSTPQSPLPNNGEGNGGPDYRGGGLPKGAQDPGEPVKRGPFGKNGQQGRPKNDPMPEGRGPNSGNRQRGRNGGFRTNPYQRHGYGFNPGSSGATSASPSWWDWGQSSVQQGWNWATQHPLQIALVAAGVGIVIAANVVAPEFVVPAEIGIALG